MAKKKYSLEQVRKSKGDLQSFTNRLILEPFFDRSTWWVANYTKFSALQLNLTGLTIGVGAAVAFFFQQFILGAILFELMNMFDTFDGRIARLKKDISKLGHYFDWYGGYWITFLMSFGLTSGIFFKTGDVRVLLFGFIMYFLLTIRFVEGHVVALSLGGEKSYKKIVRKGKTQPLLSKIRSLLIKKGYREPFNMTDNQHLLFFLLPVTGWYLQIYWLVFFGILLIQGVWFINNKGLLMQKDKSKK